MATAEVDAWSGPTRELESTELARLLHQTKAVYPTYQHRVRALRIAIGIAVMAMIAIAVMMALAM